MQGKWKKGKANNLSRKRTKERGKKKENKGRKEEMKNKKHDTSIVTKKEDLRK